MDEVEWRTCDDPEYVLPFLIDEVGASDRKQRLFACACCARVAHLVSPDLLLLLRLAERYADGAATATELNAAYAIERQRFGQWNGSDPHFRPAEAATEAFLLTARIGISKPSDSWTIHFAQEVSAIAAVAVEHAERDYNSLCAESRHQLVYIHDIFGNPFHPVAFDPAWRSSDVQLLAEGIYTDRAFDQLPILADALQEAGCDSADLLNHLRDPNATHVRGCWALDLVLGKE